ncbi:MAG: hypothetical protein ACI956_001646, partial [Nonlabens sp.]
NCEFGNRYGATERNGFATLNALIKSATSITNFFAN